MTTSRCYCLIGRASSFVVVLLLLVLWLLSSAGGEETARWYKGNTHQHSFWSDGDDFAEMAVEWYKNRGYDFLVLTDHNTVMDGEKWVPVAHGQRAVSLSVLEKCQKRFGDDWLQLREQNGARQVKLKTFHEIQAKLAEPRKFLLIQGEEITGGFADHAVHVNALNLAECIPPQAGQNVVETITADITAVAEQAKRLDRPMLAHVNHPNFAKYDISPEDLAASAVCFFEVCNAHPAVHNQGDETHPSVERCWDIANTIRIVKMNQSPLMAIGSDDAHRYHEFSPQHANPGRAWIMVRATELSTEAILESLELGDFYASTGVVLEKVDYDPQTHTLSVSVHPEPGVTYTIEFIGTLKGANPTGSPVEGGAPNRPGRTYSPEIGKLLARVQGTTATYQLTGDELYVRAAIRSNKSIPNVPDDLGKVQQAWCQPVGWQH